MFARLPTAAKDVRTTARRRERCGEDGLDWTAGVVYLLARNALERLQGGNQRSPLMRKPSLTFMVLLFVAACTRKGPANSYAAPAGANPSLEKLVAPIALYPDPLVAQILPASTNPKEVMAAADALAGGARPSDATASQWDPSIQALLSYPTVLKMMNDRIQWTTQLGQAFTANQGGVLAAIQQVRQQAQSA